MAGVRNYRSQLKGKVPEEVAEYYDQWAEHSKYDQDLNESTYKGPTYIADEMADCHPKNRDEIEIIDIACGTGLVGEKLAGYGFTYVDGLDPSGGMLSLCKDKGFYRNLYKEFCGDTTLPIADNTYDCSVMSGGLGQGHIPCSGILEIIRIVKPEGLILITMRREFLDDITEYDAILGPFFSKLEQEHKIQILERRQVANYSFGNNGILFKIRVKKNGVL